MTTAMHQEELTREQQEVLERFLSLSVTKKERLGELVRLYEVSVDEDEKREIKRTIGEVLFRRPGDLRAEPLDDADSSARDGKARLAKHREHVANQIIKFRVAAGLTQDELAKRAGLPQSHVNRLENRKHAPTHLTLQKLADALGVRISDLDPNFDD